VDYQKKLALKFIIFVGVIFGGLAASIYFIPSARECWEATDDIQLDFQRLDINFIDETFTGGPVPMGPVLIEKVGQRLHQFDNEYGNEGEFGSIVRYRFTSTDPSKPLASHDPATFDGCYALNWGTKYCLSLKVVPKNSFWRLVKTEKIRPVLGYREQGFRMLEIANADDNFYSEVHIKVQPTHGENTPDLHMIELDFYLNRARP
jgi:hypothetical protein